MVGINHCDLVAVLVILVFSYRTKCVRYLHQLSQRIVVIVGAVAQRICLFNGIACRIVAVTRLGSKRIGYAQQFIPLAVRVGGDVALRILLGKHIPIIVVGIRAGLAFCICNFF
ncbi:hypothetical protein D3C73_1097240 [compost metagenome]